MLRLIRALIAGLFALGTLVPSPLHAQAVKEPPKTETKQPSNPAAPKKAPLDINRAGSALRLLPRVASVATE